MKKVIFIVFFIAVAIMQKAVAQINEQHASLSPLMEAYFNIKDALVKDNAAEAAANAQSFVKIANGVDYKIISESNISALIKDAGQISESKNIQKQREYFKNFSSNITALAKTLKMSHQPIYQAYCPMVKSYWLSKEKEIKNPYYGSSMLMCGNVTDTIR